MIPSVISSICLFQVSVTNIFFVKFDVGFFFYVFSLQNLNGYKILPKKKIISKYWGLHIPLKLEQYEPQANFLWLNCNAEDFFFFLTNLQCILSKKLPPCRFFFCLLK